MQISQGSWAARCARAALFVPGDPIQTSPLPVCLAWPSPTSYGFGGHYATISGIHRAARSLAVYASQTPSPTPTQHSLPGGGLGLPARESHPLGSYLKFPLFCYTVPIPFHFSQASWRTRRASPFFPHAPSSRDSLLPDSAV